MQFIDPYEEQQAKPATPQNSAPLAQNSEASTSQFIDPYEEDIKKANIITADSNPDAIAQAKQRAMDEETIAIPKAFVNSLESQGLGIKHLILAGLNKIGIVSDDAYTNLTAEDKKTIAENDQFAEEHGPASFVGGTGAIAATIPAFGALPSAAKGLGVAASKFAPRVGEAITKSAGTIGVQSAEAGAIAGAAQPVRDGETRAGNTLEGGLIGLGAGKVAQKFLTPRIKPANNPEYEAQLARANEAEELGIRTTKGQTSQEFSQQELESRLAKDSEAGGELRNYLGSQQEDIINAGRRIQGKLGGEQDKVLAGSSVQQALRQGERQQLQEVSESYQKAKDAYGIDAPVPLEGIQTKYTEVLDDFEDVIPKPIIDKFNRYGIGGEGTGEQLTVGEAEKLVKSINRRLGATNDPATGRALKELKSGVDDAIDSLEQGQDQAANLFKVARAKRKEVGDVFEQSDIVQSIVDKKAQYTNIVNPQKVIDKIIKDPSNNLENIPKIKGALVKSGANGVKAWNELRAATVTDLIEGSVKGADTGAAYFDISRFNKEVSRIGDKGLQQILTPAEYADLQKFQRVISTINRKAPGSVNTSNTATTISNMIKSSPMLGGYLGGFVKAGTGKLTKFRDIGKVNEAITGSRRATGATKKALADSVPAKNSPLIKLISTSAARFATNDETEQ